MVEIDLIYDTSFRKIERSSSNSTKIDTNYHKIMRKILQQRKTHLLVSNTIDLLLFHSRKIIIQTHNLF